MAKKVSITTFSKCFNEMKRLSGNTITDEKINQFLDEIKIKQNEDKFNQNQSRTEDILAEEVFNEFEYTQALTKRNMAEANMKALDQYEKIIDAVALSEGKLDAAQGAKALLVGIQEYSKIARNSIGAKQDTIEVVELTRLYQAINKLGDDAWNQFTKGDFDLELKKAMKGEIVEVGMVKEIAQILKNSQAEWRQRLNDLGANIGELDDWITKTTHNTEKMGNASNRSKIVGDNRVAWREFIRERLDLPRTFAGVTDPMKIDEILDGIYDSLMANDHLKHGGTNSIYGSRNIGNRLNASRVLHFKDAEARHQYDRMFGEPSLKESVLENLSNSSRNIALMQELGVNPQATFEKVLALLRKKYKSENPELVRNLNFENFKNEFAEIDGSINGVGNSTVAKVGMTIRALQSMGKLGFAAVTSIGDLAQYMSTSNFQGRGFLSGFREAINSLFKTQDQAAMSVLSVTSNSVAGSFQANKYGASMDTWGTMGKLQNMFFKYNSLNRWISSLKSGMTVGLAHHYGMLADTKFLDLSARERNLITLYGIDEGKWNMLRSIKTLDVETRRYLTAEGVNEISDNAIKSYVGRKISQREIRNFKKDLEMTWRNVLVDQAMHGTPEPDAAVRAFMNQGQKKGTGAGEGLRFIGQFKSFPMTIWKKIIGREMRSYGKEVLEETPFARVTGLTSLMLLSTVFGYIAMSAKDILRGRSPRDPEKKEVLIQALIQGGGLGIYGDFIVGELQNEYGGGTFDSLLGPTAGDITKMVSMVKSIMEGDALKTGKKFQLFAEGNIPFLNMYYSKAAYDYIIGYQIKEFLDPGFFARMENKHQEKRGQSYFLKP
tara:strand:+ start:2666 stop:5167 length:2502 start_codon:yes stop_codon:yes gene_type:complete